MNERRWAQWAVLLAIVSLAAFLRIYDLRDLPGGFFCDEAGNGFNALSLLMTGKDETGTRWPLYIWSFGVSYKNPVFIYSAMAPIWVFGADEFSVRLTSALYGIGTVIAIFYLGRAMFSAWVGLFAALLLAVCPWHIHMSRIAFELVCFPFLFVVGLTLLVRFVQGRRTFPAAMFFMSACIYSYAVAALFVPLFLIGFGLLYLPTLFRHWAQTLLALVVTAAVLAPAAHFHLTQERGGQYFRNTTHLRPDEPPLEQAKRTAGFYQQFFSRSFLFEHGDPLVRHAVRGKGFGELLPFFLPFLLIGGVVALCLPDRTSKLLLWWLALYPLGASLMNEIPSATRSFIGAPAFCLIAALGLGASLKLLGWVLRLRPLALGAQTVAVGVAAYFLVPEVVGYWNEYRFNYPKYSAWSAGGFQYGFREVVDHMLPQRDRYDVMMISPSEGNQNQIFPMFYGSARRNTVGSERDHGFMILDPAEYGRYEIEKGLLFAGQKSDLEQFSDYTVQKVIKAPGGQEAFQIAEVRARKRFIVEWLVLGLFPNDSGSGVRKDFIDPASRPEGVVDGALGEKPATWKKYVPQFTRVELNNFFHGLDPRHPGNPEHVCAYAAVIVEAAEARGGFVEISGSDDFFQAWFAGKALTPQPVMGGAPRRHPVEIPSGQNVLLIKSCEATGGWHFTARFTDDRGGDLPGVTTSATTDSGVPSA